MENATLVAAEGSVAGHDVRLRIASVIAALALVFAMFALVQERADAAPVAAVAAASVTSVGGAVAGQINNFVCAILLAVRNAFATSPFFGFIQAALAPVIARFCGIS